jgi:hypothetical protein
LLGRNLSGCSFHRGILRGSNCGGNLLRRNLGGSSFHGSILRGSNCGGNFLRRNLSRGSFHRGILHGWTRGGNFFGRNLSGCSFHRGILHGSKFGGNFLVRNLSRGSFHEGILRHLGTKVHLPGGGLVQRKALKTRGTHRGSDVRRLRQLIQGAFWRSDGSFDSGLRFPGIGCGRFGLGRRRNRLIFPNWLRNFQGSAENHRAKLASSVWWLDGLRGRLFDENRLRRCRFHAFKKR